MDGASAFQAIGLGCVSAIKSHHRKACAGDTEAVHQIRIAITRLRAAVSFFKPIVADAKWLRLKREICWLNGPLGAARDSDVMLEYAGRKHYRAWAERMIGGRLEAQRGRDHRRLVRSLHSVRTKRLVEVLAGWLKRGAWLKQRKQREMPETLERYVTEKLGHWHKRLIRKGRSLRKLDASSRHELRIKAKRLRYMLEALIETKVLPRRRALKHLHGLARQLQRTLGDLRDLEAFAGLADVKSGRRGEKHPPGYRERTDKLLDAAIRAHRELKHA